MSVAEVPEPNAWKCLRRKDPGSNITAVEILSAEVISPWTDDAGEPMFRASETGAKREFACSRRTLPVLVRQLTS
jgi:hypothetical protein